MQVLELHCSVCKSSYYSKSEWLGHLLEESHQSLARLRLVGWGKKGRSRALVVFARLPTGKDDKIIQYMSRDFGTYMADFVWWPERPRVAFVRFESKEKMKEVIGSLDNHQFKIDPDQFCEVKDGGSISELEWDGLLPEGISHREDSRKIILEKEGHSEAATFVTPKSEIIEQQPFASGSPKFSTVEGLGLRHHLSSIRKLIEIPDEEYDAALDILHYVQDVLSKIQEKTRRSGPITFNAVMFQHWNLKLRPSLSDENSFDFSILINKYNNKRSGLTPIILPRMKRILEKFVVRQDNGMMRLFKYEINPPCLEKNLNGGFHLMRYNIELPNTGHHLNFNIYNTPSVIVDAQVWRLTKYLCTFDPHCLAVMSLLHYWATNNSIAFGKLTGTYKDLGNPIGLNWLLIHYFQKQGFIPPTNLVLEQPHEVQLFEQVDIGFSDCPNFVTSWKTKRNNKNSAISWKFRKSRNRSKNWKPKEQCLDDEQFAKRVFGLLYSFFIFCGTMLTTLKKCGWIVNTRDSELISMKKLLSSGQRKSSQLSEDELLTVKSSILNGCSEKFVMLNPFNVNWRMSVSNAEEVFRAMNVAGKKLRVYLTIRSAVEMKSDRFLECFF